jgi:hypothetical protein
MADGSATPQAKPVTADSNASGNPFADVEKGNVILEAESDFDAPTIVGDSDREAWTRDGDMNEKKAARDDAGDSSEEDGEQRDANMVDWDGPQDMGNPQNWPEKKKWTVVAVLAVMTFVTYVHPAHLLVFALD